MHIVSRHFPCQTAFSSLTITNHSQEVSVFKDFEANQSSKAPLSNGFQFVIDNLDLRQKVKDLTSDNQNKDKDKYERISIFHLADDLPNGAVLPQAKDRLINKENYIVLVGRIITECIPALIF